jgi:multidrug transporter EmrE-like cation transporter
VLVLGAGVLAIELGFLFLYRRGAGLQWAGIAVTGLSALVLIPIGIAWFREGFSPGRLLGMGLTLAGLALMVRR